MPQTRSRIQVKKEKSPKKSEKEQSFRSSIKHWERLKFYQLVEVLTHDLDPEFEAHLIKRVKELSRKLFP